MRLPIIFILVLLTLPTLGQTFGETRKYFGDWLAACRPDGYCSATAYDNPNPPDGTVADYILRAGRHPKGTYWEVSLTTIAAMPEQYSEIVLKVDHGKEQYYRQNFDFGAYTSINDFFFVNSMARDLLDQMVAGNHLSASFADDKGNTQSANFSLKGLAAALLWIDEQQNRIGSERIAYAAPIGLTPVSPQFPGAVPVSLILQHTQNRNCDEFQNLPGAYRVLSGQVEKDTWIYFLPCTGGAYNLAYLAYVSWRPETYTPLIFAQYDETLGWTGTDILFNVEFNPVNRALSATYLGRGLGDCGTYGLWKWREYGFAMQEFRAKPACDGQGEPGVFPLVYRWDEKVTVPKPR